jgi:hypothetical protein
MTGRIEKKSVQSRGTSVLAVIIALACLSGAEACAQTRGDRPSLRVLVEDPGEEGNSCGFTKDSLENEAARVLRNNGVRAIVERSSLSQPFLYLNVNAVVLNQGVLCVTNIRAAVRSYMAGSQAKSSFRSRDGLALQVLCENGALQAWPRGGGKPNVEAVINGCLGQLDY